MADKNLLCRINLKELDGLFLFNIASKLKSLSAHSKSENKPKISIELDVRKILLNENRSIRNVVCRGSFQDLELSRDFILSLDIDGESGKSFKVNFDNKKGSFVAENIQPLLYAFGETDIKYCGFKISRNKENEYELHVVNFENSDIAINNSTAKIDFVDKRYIKVEDLIVRLGLIDFVFDVKFDIKEQKFEKKMTSFSLAPFSK
jgi:hypothetical protein